MCSVIGNTTMVGYDLRDRSIPVSVEEAQRIILNSARPLNSEKTSLMVALNRILYEDIVSEEMIPSVDDSALDGYALIAEDTAGASVDNPARLQVIGEVRAGDSVNGHRISSGTAVRIMTGAPIPEGADSVVRVESTEEEAGYVKIFEQAIKHNNYRFAGENIKTGDRVLSKGIRISTAEIGLLASLNYDLVNVYRQPTVSIISTGDEVTGMGEELHPGKVRDVNTYTLYSEVRKCNALPEYMDVARDNLNDTREKFVKALKSDVVISTGGVSMGKFDFIKDVYNDLGIDIQIEWVNLKPGSPFTFGTKGHKLFFGLPGRPVSTLVTFNLFVRPALLKLMGAKQIRKPIVKAFLLEDINRKSDKVHMLRGFFSVRDNEFHVSTTGNQKPSVLRSMSDANCLIIIPENSPKLRAGDQVAIQLIDHQEIE